ncbi:MAG: YIP1 family protein [Anaerolineales bacterium]|nr:YIP1 family protein [Anaerolineales bacterium]
METTQKRRLFWSFYKGLFLRPTKTFQELLLDDRRVKFGFFAILIPAIGYTLFYFMAWQGGGAPSTFKPWLALPIEDYYYYDIFLVAPSMLLCWISTSGVVHLLSRLFSGEGTYEDTITVIGFGISVATWSTLIHDFTDAFLGFIGVIDLKAYEMALNAPTFWRALLLTLFAIYFIWFLVLFTKGIRTAHSLPLWKSFLLAFIGLVTYQVLFLVFNR